MREVLAEILLVLVTLILVAVLFSFVLGVFEEVMGCAEKMLEALLEAVGCKACSLALVPPKPS